MNPITIRSRKVDDLAGLGGVLDKTRPDDDRPL